MSSYSMLTCPLALTCPSFCTCWPFHLCKGSPVMRLNEALASDGRAGRVANWQVLLHSCACVPQSRCTTQPLPHLLFPCSSWKDSETLKGQLPFSSSAAEDCRCRTGEGSHCNRSIARGQPGRAIPGSDGNMQCLEWL